MGHLRDIDKVTRRCKTRKASRICKPGLRWKSPRRKYYKAWQYSEVDSCFDIDARASENLPFKILQILELQDGLFPSDKTGVTVHGALYRESTFIIVPPNWCSWSSPEDLNCKGMSSAWNPPSAKPQSSVDAKNLTVIPVWVVYVQGNCVTKDVWPYNKMK